MAKRILLADDSITIQKVVELTFSDGDYEVTAVNNGAKAIQKLSEMRPDIILSDIIMPEKNGYEVCEFVKSHPDYRNIPVVLLTGTFEPFDPDRADKAGCDAVVTKPFESQSLIQKVEELITASKANAPTQQTAAVEEPPAYAPEPFAAESPFAAPPPPAAEPFEGGGFEAHGGDIFGAAPESTPPTTEMPFEAPAFGGETRAFPRMSFEELQRMANEPAAAPPPPAAPEPSPWEEAPATGGETRAFPRMSFEELQRMAVEPAAAPPPAAPEPSPWEGASGGETRAFPAMSMDTPATPEASPWDTGPEESAAAGDTMSPFAAEPEAPPPAAEASPWDQEAPAYSGETRAFPRMSLEEMQRMAAEQATPAPEPPPAAPEASPWDEAPATGGETRAFPRMSLEEMQQMVSPQPAAAPEPEPSPWEEPAESSEPAWSPEPEPEPAAEAASPFGEETPFEPEVTPPLPEPVAEPAEAVNSQITDDIAAAAPAGDLTDAQVDRIARRVVQLISEQVVRNIAWEVIPDMAEMVVKERIRQLEAQD